MTHGWRADNLYFRPCLFNAPVAKLYVIAGCATVIDFTATSICSMGNTYRIYNCRHSLASSL
jgi:hypothetical protein